MFFKLSTYIQLSKGIWLTKFERNFFKKLHHEK